MEAIHRIGRLGIMSDPAPHRPDTRVAQEAALGMGQPVGRALPARGIHAHVQRAVGTKRKTPRGVVDLRRADAQIHQHPRHAARRPLGQRREALVADRKARVLNARCFGQRLRILVESDQPTLGGQPLQDQARMSAAAERGVHILTARVRDQGVDRLVQQDRGV